MARESRKFTVGSVSDFPVGTHQVVNIDGREIGLFNINGMLYGLPNLCTHQLGPLCEGRVSGTLIARVDTGWKPLWVHEGEIVTCPWHGLEYNVRTGQCLAYPEVRLRTYEVWVEDNLVKIRL